ncbi:3-dehydroquinate synthase family protein [Streptomyces chartreusis]
MLEQDPESFVTGRWDVPATEELMSRAIEVMLSELAPNLREEELSRSVDLGHTFSQAFEIADGVVPLRHGEAVSLDLTLSTIVSARRGMLPVEDLVRTARLTRRLGLPVALPHVPVEVLWNSVMERTLHRAGRQRLPLPFRIGECEFVNDLTIDELGAALDFFPELFKGDAGFGLSADVLTSGRELRKGFGI